MGEVPHAHTYKIKHIQTQMAHTKSNTYKHRLHIQTQTHTNTDGTYKIKHIQTEMAHTNASIYKHRWHIQTQTHLNTDGTYKLKHIQIQTQMAFFGKGRDVS